MNNPIHLTASVLRKMKKYEVINNYFYITDEK